MFLSNGTVTNSNGVIWQQHIVCYSNVVHTECSYQMELWRTVTVWSDSNTLCVTVMFAHWTYITNWTVTVCKYLFLKKYILCYNNVVHSERSYQIELWRSETACSDSNTSCVSNIVHIERIYQTVMWRSVTVWSDSKTLWVSVMLCTLNVHKTLNYDGL